jgi:hypothetical protein
MFSSFPQVFAYRTSIHMNFYNSQKSTSLNVFYSQYFVRSFHRGVHVLLPSCNFLSPPQFPSNCTAISPITNTRRNFSRIRHFNRNSFVKQQVPGLTPRNDQTVKFGLRTLPSINTHKYSATHLLVPHKKVIRTDRIIPDVKLIVPS